MSFALLKFQKYFEFNSEVVWVYSSLFRVDLLFLFDFEHFWIVEFIAGLFFWSSAPWLFNTVGRCTLPLHYCHSWPLLPSYLQFPGIILGLVWIVKDPCNFLIWRLNDEELELIAEFAWFLFSIKMKQSRLYKTCVSFG